MLCLLEAILRKVKSNSKIYRKELKKKEEKTNAQEELTVVLLGNNQRKSIHPLPKIDELIIRTLKFIIFLKCKPLC